MPLFLTAAAAAAAATAACAAAAFEAVTLPLTLGDGNPVCGDALFIC